MKVNSQLGGGRVRQKARTRRLLLEAVDRLMQDGIVPTVEQAAAEADVSAATGYRYFPTQGALLNAAVEASFQGLPLGLFSSPDAEGRIDELIDLAFPNLVANELLDRAVLRLSLDQWLRTKAGHGPREEEARRAGRKPLIKKVIEPLRGELDRASLRRLELGLGMLLGIEAYVALADIYGLSPRQVGEVWRWACKAMIRQAVAEASETRSGR